jgi:uncharacterized protein
MDLLTKPKVEPELLMVPMSDGVKLAVHRYPANISPAPAVVNVTPYRKEGRLPYSELLSERGYDLFVADARGFGGSVAPYEGLISQREIQDYVELVEWIAKQKFCDGKVGSIGGSYTGASQLVMAARKPKGLACISPMVGPVDTYRDWTKRGALHTFHHWSGTYWRSGQPATFKTGLKHYQCEIMSDPFDNDAHRARSGEYVLSKIEVPAMMIGGWHDYFLRGTTRSFLKIPAPKRLMIGPWGHANINMWQDEDGYRWLDFWLKGRGSDPTKGRNVKLYRTGAEEWFDRETWFDFQRARFQAWQPFAKQTQVPVLSGFEGQSIPTNIRPEFPPESGFAHWPEFFVTDGEAFSKPTDIDGHIGFEMHLDPGECTDVEIHVRLSCVKSDGKVQQLTEGRLLASHRANDPKKSYLNAEGAVIVPWHPHDRAEPLEPGKPATINIEINPICHRMQPGDRLRLGLSLVRADLKFTPSAAHMLPQTRLLLPIVEV